MVKCFLLVLTAAVASRLAFAVPVIQSPAEATTNRVSLGAHITFRVNATSATSPAISYQWLFGGDEIPGATNAVLVLSGVRTNHMGTYRASVSDPDGPVVSPPYLLRIG